jgi:hypothetical protein
MGSLWPSAHVHEREFNMASDRYAPRAVECQPSVDLNLMVWILIFAAQTRGEAVMKVSLQLVFVSYVMVPLTAFLRGRIIPVVYPVYFVVEVVGVEWSLRSNPIDRSDESQWTCQVSFGREATL